MIFGRQRNLTNKIFYTKTSFISFGGSRDAEEEQITIENFGYPVIDMGGQHKGYFGIEGIKVVVVGAETVDAEEVEIVLNSQKKNLDSEFSIDFYVDAKKETPGLNLDTGSKMAEAKCILFEKALEEKIQDALDTILQKESDFEIDYPTEITIPPVLIED